MHTERISFDWVSNYKAQVHDLKFLWHEAQAGKGTNEWEVKWNKQRRADELNNEETNLDLMMNLFCCCSFSSSPREKFFVDAQQLYQVDGDKKRDHSFNTIINWKPH